MYNYLKANTHFWSKCTAFDIFKIHGRNAKCKTMISTSRVKENVLCSVLILSLNTAITGWNICPQQQVLTHICFLRVLHWHIKDTWSRRGPVICFRIWCTFTFNCCHFYTRLILFIPNSFSAWAVIVKPSSLEYMYVPLSLAIKTPQILQDKYLWDFSFKDFAQCFVLYCLDELLNDKFSTSSAFNIVKGVYRLFISE